MRMINKSKSLKLAKCVVENYNVSCDVKFSNIEDKALYDFDNNVIKISNTYKFTISDFITTVLHEVKHVIDITRLGYDKYIKKYNQAGTMAVKNGKDFHDDNRWEIKAEKWAYHQMNTILLSISERWIK